MDSVSEVSHGFIFVESRFQTYFSPYDYDYRHTLALFIYSSYTACSACGHLSYMLVRMGPVFRIGSLYFPEEAALQRWAALNDTQRLRELVALKHPYFALELGLLLVACIYFMYLRINLLLS